MSNMCHKCGVSYVDNESLRKHLEICQVGAAEIIAAVSSITGTALPAMIEFESFTEAGPRVSSDVSVRSRTIQRRKRSKIRSVSKRVVESKPMGISRKATAPSQVFAPKAKSPKLSVVKKGSSATTSHKTCESSEIINIPAISPERVVSSSIVSMTPFQLAQAVGELPEQSAEEITSRIAQYAKIPSELLSPMEYAVGTAIAVRREASNELFKLLGTAVDEASLRARIGELAAQLGSHPVPRMFK